MKSVTIRMITFGMMIAVIAGSFIVDALMPGLSVWAYMSVALLLGVVIMLLNARLRKKAVDAATDERMGKIAGEAALFTWRIFMSIALLATVVFLNLASENRDFFVVGITLFVTFVAVLGLYLTVYAIKKAKG